MTAKQRYKTIFKNLSDLDKKDSATNPKTIKNGTL